MPTSPAPSSTSTSQGTHALLALLGGFLAGTALEHLSPSSARLLLPIADPVGSMWVNAIRMTVIPLVVALIVSGVVQSSGTGAVGRLTARAVLVFVFLLTSIALFTAVVAPWIYRALPDDPNAAAALRASVDASVATTPEMPGFVAWLTDLVPVNPVKAAADGAMLPLIVFTVLFALALRRLEPGARAAMTTLFRAVADAMLVLVHWVLALSPLGIGALALALGIRLGAGAAGAVGFYLVSHCALLLAAVLLLYPFAVIAGRTSPAVFARAALPAQVVAMSTRSSIAALPAMLEAAEQRLGVPRETGGFLVPFAVSTFRLNLAVSWIVGGLFLAKLYGVPFGTSALATFFVAAITMSFSVPGIPSGSLFIISPLLPTVGLPVEGVGILIALDAVPDIFKTLLNVTGHLAATVAVTRDRSREPAGMDRAETSAVSSEP